MTSKSIQETASLIAQGQTSIGIELGSTRIKTVMIGPDNSPIASGSHDWENALVDGVWSYSVEDIWGGVQASYKSLVDAVKAKYGVEIKSTKSLGFSGMMHGYMAFDKDDNLLVPFRTWRNNFTGQASAELTELFQYPIPQRWTIAHLYQAILNGEAHVKDVRFVTTVAGYVHWKLTGQKVLGVGEASGMMPIDLKTGAFDTRMIGQFDQKVAANKFPWKLGEILASVKPAGEKGGELTAEGARLLDVSGKLQAGVPFCPPEGDAGTGMVATNSVSVRTGNVSAGTSVFAMIVLEKELSKVYSEIDLVTTAARQAGGHGALEQLLVGIRRLDRHVRRTPQVLRRDGRQVAAVQDAVRSGAHW